MAQLDSTLRAAVLCLSGLFLFSAAETVAGVGTVRISSDPFTNSSSQHMTEVEPHIFATGSTIVATFQQGRVFGGGASDIGFATSIDSGATWQDGSLPGITMFYGGGPYPRASDPSVVFDVAHQTWMIAVLPATGRALWQRPDIGEPLERWAQLGRSGQRDLRGERLLRQTVDYLRQYADQPILWQLLRRMG